MTDPGQAQHGLMIRAVTHGHRGQGDAFPGHGFHNLFIAGVAGLAVGEEDDMPVRGLGLGQGIEGHGQRRIERGATAGPDAADGGAHALRVTERTQGPDPLSGVIKGDHADTVLFCEHGYRFRGGLLGHVQARDAPGGIAHGPGLVDHQDQGGGRKLGTVAHIHGDGQQLFQVRAPETAQGIGAVSAKGHKPESEVAHSGDHGLQGFLADRAQVKVHKAQGLPGQQVFRCGGQRGGRQGFAVHACGTEHALQLGGVSAAAFHQEHAHPAHLARKCAALIVLGHRVARHLYPRFPGGQRGIGRVRGEGKTVLSAVELDIAGGENLIILIQIDRGSSGRSAVQGDLQVQFLAGIGQGWHRQIADLHIRAGTCLGDQDIDGQGGIGRRFRKPVGYDRKPAQRAFAEQCASEAQSLGEVRAVRVHAALDAGQGLPGGGILFHQRVLPEHDDADLLLGSSAERCLGKAQHFIFRRGGGTVQDEIGDMITGRRVQGKPGQRKDQQQCDQSVHAHGNPAPETAAHPGRAQKNERSRGGGEQQEQDRTCEFRHHGSTPPIRGKAEGAAHRAGSGAGPGGRCAPQGCRPNARMRSGWYPTRTPARKARTGRCATQRGPARKAYRCRTNVCR